MVAGEVKALSLQTQEAVVKICESIQQIQENSKCVAERMRDLDERSEQIRDTISAFNDRVHETSGMNADATRRVLGANDRVFMSLAKLDHVVWKVNTYLSVIDGEPVFEFVDCHNCRLGKWYYEGDGQLSFSMAPSFRGLESPHAKVHAATREVFRILQTDVSHDDDGIETSLQQMEEGSDGVFQFLDRMLMEKSTT